MEGKDKELENKGRKRQGSGEQRKEKTRNCRTGEGKDKELENKGRKRQGTGERRKEKTTLRNFKFSSSEICWTLVKYRVFRVFELDLKKTSI